MRLALLSSMAAYHGAALSDLRKGREPVSSDEGAAAIASLPLAGRKLIDYQLDAVLAIGADRLVVYGERLTPELIDLQHRAERAGLSFQLIDSARPLSGLVSAADDIIVLAEGMVIAPELAIEALGGHRAIAAFPAEKAVAAGYERMDSERAFAGLMLLPGRTVEMLAQLPEDAEPVSSLLRIGLQMGTAIHMLPEAVQESSEWQIVTANTDMAGLDAEMTAHRLGPAPRGEPGAALANRLARRLASPLLARGFGAAQLTVIAAVLVAASLGLGWAVSQTAGFALLALAAFGFAFAGDLGRLQHSDDKADKGDSAPLGAPASLACLDVAILVLVSAPWNWHTAIPWAALFAPLMMLGWWHMAGLSARPQWLRFGRDMTLLCLILAALAMGGALQIGTALIALVMMVLVLSAMARRPSPDL